MCETELMLKAFNDLVNEQTTHIDRLREIGREMKKLSKLIQKDPNWINAFLNMRD